MDDTTPTVDVWVGPLDVAGGAASTLLATLDDRERARMARYRSPDHGHRIGVARGWLRTVLGSELGLAPAAVTFAVGPHGKPHLRGPVSLWFNLSHAGDLALIAVSRAGEVGVDVEDSGRHRAALAAARIACTPDEVAVLDGLDPAPRAAMFLGWWTAKEAYLKGTGRGLGGGLDRVDVRAAEVVDRGRATGWFVRRLVPAPGYVGAVAAEGSGWTVRVRRAEGLATATSAATATAARPA